MNVLDAAQVLDYAVSLGYWPRATDAEHLAQQVAAWAEVLEDAPLDFAMRFLQHRDSQWGTRPSEIHAAWAEDQKAERARNANRYDDRACPHPQVCSCTHGVDACYRGWLDEPRDRAATEGRVPAQRWCPRCWDARNIKRQESGLEPRLLGIIGK